MSEKTIIEIDEAIKKTGAKTVRFHIGGGQYVEFPVVNYPSPLPKSKIE